MSHISVGVEYGLHCLLYISGPPIGVTEASVRDMAELQGLSVEFVAKLFTKLRRAGLTEATEGKNGGFRLARPADQISVLDVVHAIDGARSLFECREIRDRCAVFEGHAPRWATAGVCSIHAVMLEAEKRMREVLSSETLADLAGRVDIKAPRSYGAKIVHWIEDRRAPM